MVFTQVLCTSFFLSISYHKYLEYVFSSFILLSCCLKESLNIIFCIGLISPGVSVPVQIPGGGHQDMGVHHMTSMTSQYWPRIQ